MKQLRDKLIQDLTDPKVMTDHVSRSLMDLCELQSNEVKDFLANRSGEIDEPLIDTIFSPMYTPDWNDRARYVEDRERVENITPTVLEVIIDDLAAASLTATFHYEDDLVTMPLPEVMIDRWVRRLYLDVKVDDRILKAIEATVPTEFQSLVKALVGDSAWRAEGRDAILIEFLTSYARTGQFSGEKFEHLTGLVHSFRPRDLAHFTEQVDHLVQSYRDDNAEHFFDSHLKEAHGPLGVSSPVTDHLAEGRRQQIMLTTQIQEDLRALGATSPS